MRRNCFSSFILNHSIDITMFNYKFEKAIKGSEGNF